MEIDRKEIRIDTTWRGPKKGSTLKLTHLPTGISIEEEIPADIPVLQFKNELMKRLFVLIENTD